MNSLCSIHGHGLRGNTKNPPISGTFTTPTISGYTYAYLFTGNGIVTLPASKTATVLIVGGGGGGGSWSGRNWALNGGGAGGLGYGSLSLASGTTYNITVGTFGTCLYGGANGASSSGGNSSIIGGTINEIAYGGGGGGSVGQNYNTPAEAIACEAQSGGSGGGYSGAATIGYPTTATTVVGLGGAGVGRRTREG